MFGPSGARSSVPARTSGAPARAGAVKIGRRGDGDTYCDISRLHLDGPEHGGRLMCAGIDRLLLLVAALVVDRREIAEGGVTSPRIVEALDELEHGHARFGLGLEAAPIEKLALSVAKKLSAIALS